MPDKAQTEVKPAADAAASATPTPPRRSPGHRGQDVRDAVAEMAARAQEISLEAGSKMSGALRDVIHAAAGLAGFAIESARDLVQYMVRRGQMTQDDADRLIRDAEDAARKNKRPIVPPTKVVSRLPPLKTSAMRAAEAKAAALAAAAPAVKPAPVKQAAPSHPPKAAGKKPPAKSSKPVKPAARPAVTPKKALAKKAKPAAKHAKPAAKKPSPKKAAPKKKR